MTTTSVVKSTTKMTSVPAQPVERGTVEAPYQFGDRCHVLVALIGGEAAEWWEGVILACAQPRGARRFVCTVAIGTSIHSAYQTDRIYCNADGRGDEIWPSLAVQQRHSTQDSAARVTAGHCGDRLIHPETGRCVAICSNDDANHAGIHKQHGGPGWARKTS